MPERAVATTKTPEIKQKCSSSCKQNPSFNSSGSSVDRILHLQRTAGNQAIKKLIVSEILQTKIKTGYSNGGIFPDGIMLGKLIKQCEDTESSDKIQEKEIKNVNIEKLPIFNQNNYPDVKLGNSSLKKSGCLVTSLTMVANALGVDPELTPDKAAEKLKFTSTGALTGGIAAIGLKEDSREEKSELFIQMMDKELEKETNPGLIIQIDYKSDEKGDHFVQVRSKKDRRYFAADPAFGTLISFKLSEEGIMSEIQNEAANKFYTKNKTPKVVKVIKYSALGQEKK